MHIFSTRLLLILCFFSSYSKSFGQASNIRPPVDIPIFLAGNYGELRSTHFHAGIDIKTQSVVGHSILAVQSGYVSRIKVQSGGYGHALYITHPSGLTSVYGHLQEYYPALEAYLKKQQYQRKSFEVDIYLEKDQFLVTKGQKVAISGNSGRSTGPHLHFELRNSRQVPQNVLKYNLPIKDTIAPKFRKLAVYNAIDSNTFESLDKRFYSVSGGGNGKYSINNPILVNDKVAFGVEVYDYLNGSNNKCGVYTLEFYLDDNIIFSFTVDNISFGQMKYIKTHMDYAEKKLNKRNVHKLYREPNNVLSIYSEVVNEGLITVDDSLEHKGLLKAIDVYGNVSTLDFLIIKNENPANQIADTGEFYLPYNEAVIFQKDRVTLDIPKGSVYSNCWLTYISTPSDNYLTAIHHIGDELVPLNLKPELKIKVNEELNNINTEKLIIARINGEDGLVSYGGQWSDSSISASISSFGRFVVVADTLSPEIKPLSFKNGGWYASTDQISFKITDDLSGIKTYNGYIDGEWALFEYDAKSDLLVYKIDNSRLTRTKGKHRLEIYVMDERNNVGKFEGNFYF